MKSGIVYFFVLLVVMFVLDACSKETSDEFRPDLQSGYNDTSWTATVMPGAAVFELKNMLSRSPEKATMNVTNGGTVVFNSGVRLVIEPNSVSGAIGEEATVELDYLETKGDMVRFFRPTVSNGRLLESGGAFNVRVTQNGKSLGIAAGSSIRIRYAASAVDPGMQLFYGDTSVPGSFNWLPADTGNVSVFSDPDTSGISLGYELLSSRFDWINCDKFIDTGSLTKLFCVLPVNCTNNNTAVFMVFNDYQSVLQLIPGAPLKTFYIDKVPLGAAVTLISISLIGEDLYMATGVTNITGDQLVSLLPLKTTQDAILAYLESL